MEINKTIRKPMKLTPEKIYTHFNTVRDTVGDLPGTLLWFCIDKTSLDNWNDTHPREKHLRKITLYLMAKNGCPLSSKIQASQITTLMGSDIYDVQIAPVDNGLIKSHGYFFELSDREIPSKILKTISETDIFHVDFLARKGFVVLEDDGVRGVAVDRSGWKVLNWNREGCGVSYFGEKMEKNSWLEVHMDGGTRKGFHGVVYNREHVELLIDLTR